MRQLLDYVDILIMAPCYLGYAWAAGEFCKRHLGTSGKKELLFVLFSFGGWLVLNIAVTWYHTPQILYAMLSHLLFMGLVFFCFGAGWEKKMLAVSLLMIVSRLVVNILVPCLSCLVLLFKYSVKNMPEPLVNDWEGGLIGAFGFCMAAFAVTYMTKHFASIFSGKPGKWYVMLAVPLFVIVAVFDVADWGACHGIMVRSGGNMGLYYDQIFSHTQFVVLAVISLAAAVFYVCGMDRIYLEQKKNGQYHSQIAVYKMLTEQYRQSERLRHDMKNHIIALSGLVRNEEWEKLGDYLKNMEGSGLEGCEEVTGNRAVDALLYQKRQQAREGKIRWECDVQIPKECGINEFELCVLFGNLLDNALEACGRLPDEECRFVNVQAKMVKKCFLLEVKNSMDRTESMKIKTMQQLCASAALSVHAPRCLQRVCIPYLCPAFQETSVSGKTWGTSVKSTASACAHYSRNVCVEADIGHKDADGFSRKENPGEHGIGLLNVGDVVHRYQGVMQAEAADGIFVVSVLMPFQDATHDIKTAV